MRNIPRLKMPGIDLSLATHILRELDHTPFYPVKKERKNQG